MPTLAVREEDVFRRLDVEQDISSNFDRFLLISDNEELKRTNNNMTQQNQQDDNDSFFDEENAEMEEILLDTPAYCTSKNIQGQRVIEKYANSMVMVDDNDHFDLTAEYDVSPFKVH